MLDKITMGNCEECKLNLIVLKFIYFENLFSKCRANFNSNMFYKTVYKFRKSKSSWFRKMEKFWNITFNLDIYNLCCKQNYKILLLLPI